jgi:membrane associated rhomboid family serine protease
MYALLLLGNTLESALGRNKFLLIFLISQIGASFASLYANPENQPSVGASGAIFGLFGAMAVLTKKYGFQDKSIYAVIGINFAIGFVLPGIDWQAHLGGFISGVLISLFLLAPTRR